MFSELLYKNRMKNIKKIAILGLSLLMLNGCAIRFTTNPYSPGWKKNVPLPRFYRQTIFGSLKKEIKKQRTGYLVLTMHPEKLNDLKIYKLNLDKQIEKKDLDELVFDTYNNVVLGVSRNEILKVVTIKEKGYKGHPSPPLMEKDGKFSDTKRPYPKYITEAKYTGHILSLEAIGENKGIFPPEQKKQELFNHFEHYTHVWMGYGTMLFSTRQGKLGTVLHEAGGETTVGSTKGCIALEKEDIKYFLEYTKMGATVRFTYDPVIELVNDYGETSTIKLGFKDKFKIHKKNFEEYVAKNEAADQKKIPYLLKRIKK